MKKKYKYVYTYVSDTLTESKENRKYNFDVLGDYRNQEAIDVNIILGNKDSILNKLKNISDTQKYNIILAEYCSDTDLFHRMYRDYIPNLLDDDGVFAISNNLGKNSKRNLNNFFKQQPHKLVLQDIIVPFYIYKYKKSLEKRGGYDQHNKNKILHYYLEQKNKYYYLKYYRID